MDESSEKLKEELRYQGRVRYLADAAKIKILNSGIPPKLMKIKADEFKQLLCPLYHKGSNFTPDELTEFVYQRPQELLQKHPIILIDGGRNYRDRKKAGCALLFRFLAANIGGLLKDFGEANETLKRFNAFDNSDLEKTLKEQDVLFLNEFYPEMLQKSPGGVVNCWDAILEKRYDNNNPTIFSFTRPLPSNDSNALDDQSCGLFMQLLINNDLYHDLEVLRIRVK